MNELLKSLRLGAVSVFGILVPGLAVLTSLAYLFRSEQRALCEDILGMSCASRRLEVAVAVLTLAYVFGFVVRLIPMDWLDTLSRWAQNLGKRPKTKLLDRYPYSNVRSVLEECGLTGLADYVTWEKRPARSHVSCLKLLVMERSPVLANSLASVEAHIRMMFGVFVAGAIGLGVVLWKQPLHAYWLLLVTIGSTQAIIIWTFNRTRYSELVKLLAALKLCAIKREETVEKMIAALQAPPSARHDEVHQPADSAIVSAHANPQQSGEVHQ